MSPRIPPAENVPRCENASCELKLESGMMLGNFAQPVERILACTTSEKTEVALVSTSKKLKGLQGRARKMGPYLGLNSIIFSVLVILIIITVIILPPKASISKIS
jgi:hypothetical protein